MTEYAYMHNIEYILYETIIEVNKGIENNSSREDRG